MQKWVNVYRRADFDPRRLTNLIAILLVGILLISAATPARADDGAPPTPDNGPSATTAPSGGGVMLVRLVQRVRRLCGEIGLTADQQEKVDAILDKAENDATAMAPDLQSLTPQERVAKVRPFVQGVRKQLSAVLTPQQRRALLAKLKAANANAGPAGRMQKLRAALQTLDLDDQQKAQADDAIEEAVSQYKELMEERRSGQDVQVDVQQVGEDLREKLKSILTPEQIKDLRTAMQSDAASPATPTTRPSDGVGGSPSDGSTPNLGAANP